MRKSDEPPDQWILGFAITSPQLRRDNSGKANKHKRLHKWVGLDALPESGRGAISV